MFLSSFCRSIVFKCVVFALAQSGHTTHNAVAVAKCEAMSLQDQTVHFAESLLRIYLECQHPAVVEQKKKKKKYKLNTQH